MIKTELRVKKSLDELSPSYNIAPTQDILIINQEGEKQLIACTWGLIPSWAKDPSTSLPMIIADELEADWKHVRFEFAPVGDKYKDPVWGMQSTGGSTSIRHMHDALRTAGAAAREMLIVAGAEALKVPLKECAAMNGIVRHMKTGKGLTYGKLVFEASRLSVPQNPTLKKDG